PGDGDLAETAVALAPPIIPRDALCHDAYQVLGCADLYARKHAQRVVFFSDLTSMFTTAGTLPGTGRPRLPGRAGRAPGRPVPRAVPDHHRARVPYICDPSAYLRPVGAAAHVRTDHIGR